MVGPVVKMVHGAGFYQVFDGYSGIPEFQVLLHHPRYPPIHI